jgi:hypothetical protein
VRTDLVLPVPGWQRTLSLSSAEGLSVNRGEVSTWEGTLSFDARQRLRFKQTVREADGRLVIAAEYTALDALTAEGLFFRINIPWVDFNGGTADNGLRSATLPEIAPQNNNLLYGETAQLDARNAAGTLRWSARFDRAFPVNLQDKSNESPKNYTFWIYLFHGFGGNYCFQIESPVTDHTLENLTPRWARTEMSLLEWEPRNDNPSPYDTDFGASTRCCGTNSSSPSDPTCCMPATATASSRTCFRSTSPRPACAFCSPPANTATPSAPSDRTWSGWG